MPHMVPGKFVNGCLNGLDAPLDPHGLCGEVGVSSSSVPVTSHRLWVKRHHDTEVLRHPLEEVSADPEVVAHVDSLCGANLVLPLGGHHLGVGSRHPDPSIEASSVVSLNNVSSIDIAGANCAIVRALRSREAVLGPAEGMAVLVEKCVLLLNSKPGVVVLGLLHHLGALLPLVRLRLLL